MRVFQHNPNPFSDSWIAHVSSRVHHTNRIMLDHHCDTCHRAFSSIHALNTHAGRAHRTDSQSRKRQRSLSRSPSPIYFQDEMPKNPFYRFENDLIYITPHQDVIIDNQVEVDFPGNPISRPFRSRKELDHIRWALEANVSRTSMTKFLQLNKKDRLFSSKNMLQISAQIKRIPEQHPHLASGTWITDTMGR